MPRKRTKQQIPEPLRAQGFVGEDGRLQVLILCLGIKAGTFLADAGEVTVTEDHGIGVVDLQRLQQGMQGCLLLPGASVGVTAFRGQAAFVANADGVLVIVPGMCPRQVLVSRLVHLTVTGDIVMVSGEPKPCVVAGYQVFNRESAVTAGRRTMDNNKVNSSHSFFIHLDRQAPMQPCTAMVPRIVVMTVAAIFSTFTTLFQFTLIIVCSV